MEATQDLAGTIVAAKWRLEAPLGRGTFGDVWIARHVVTGGRRALKLLFAEFSASQEFVDRFVKESQAASRVESPHVVGVDDIGFDDTLGRAFLVMELLRGESLYAYITQAPFAMPAGEATVVLRQLADALDAAHAADIVHRDLKPENVFLSWRADGTVQVKVLDFGIAKLAGSRVSMLPPVPGERDASDASATVGFIGTPGYASPEQIEDAGSVTRAADIFALGVCAYEMLTGTSYWRARGSTLELFDEVSRGVVEPASRRAPQGVHLAEGFDAWFACACAVDPTVRFASAGEAVVALERVLGQTDPLPSPTRRGAVDAGSGTDGRWRANHGEGGSGPIVLLADARTMAVDEVEEATSDPARVVTQPIPRARRTRQFSTLLLGAMALVVATLALRPARVPARAATRPAPVAARVVEARQPVVTPPAVVTPVAAPITAPAAAPAPVATARPTLARRTPLPVAMARRRVGSLVNYEPPGL